MERKIGKALVIGAGIGGIRSALDLAEPAIQVTLIDRAAHIGGHAEPNSTTSSPATTAACASMLPLLNRDAGSQFCLRKGLFHDNIEIFTGTEISAMTGEAGHFTARLRQPPTWVDPQLCVGCGPVPRSARSPCRTLSTPGSRSARPSYLPVPHAIPNPYMIDHTACTRCGACVDGVPDPGAIRLGADRRAELPHPGGG
jgi:heterodisulfide reductase subunit A2